MFEIGEGGKSLYTNSTRSLFRHSHLISSLEAYCVASIVLGTWDSTSVTKRKIPVLMECTF